jgi:hypothetical protein
MKNTQKEIFLLTMHKNINGTVFQKNQMGDDILA